MAENFAPEYPVTHRGTEYDVLHGQMISDPYRWLEKIDSPEVIKWTQDQNQLTRRFLDGVPQRPKIEALVKSFASASVAPPLHVGGLYYFVSKGSLYSGTEEKTPLNLLVNVQELMQNPKAAIIDMNLSPDGQKISFIVGIYGADFPSEIFIYDIKAGQLIESSLVKGSTNYGAQNWIRGPFWMPDSQSYIYTKVRLGDYKRPLSSTLVWHKLGADPVTDKIVFADATPRSQTELWYGRPTNDGRYLVVESQSSEQEPTVVGLVDLQTSDFKVSWISEIKKYHYVYLGTNGTQLFFRSGANANNLKISSFRIKDILAGHPKEKTIVPEALMPIHAAVFANGKILVAYTNPKIQQSHEAIVFSETGKKLSLLQLPGAGTIDNFRLSSQTAELYFQYSDYFQARILMKLDLSKMQVSVIDKPTVAIAPGEFKISTRATRANDKAPQIHYTILEPKALKADQKAPLFLYIYGNVASVITPSYNAKWLSWLRMGGRVVVAHVRGGAEKGAAWVNAGRAQNKLNTLTDTIQVAEALIQQGLTEPGKILLDGRSSGGFNVSALANIRPDLFGVIAATCPMADMIRFPSLAWGNRWLYEYGDPMVKSDFDVLAKLSPYHNVKALTPYPSIIIFATDHDDRVNPSHAYKFAAALQNANSSENPILIYQDKDASHGSKVETLDELTFAAWRMNLEL